VELLPILDRSFEGWYLWHSKRTLRRVSLVRKAAVEGRAVGLSMLKEVGEGVGYVFYLAVLPDFRRRRIGGSLLDDALSLFASQGESCVYATVEEDNEPSLALFRSRGFVEVGFDDLARLHGRLRAVYMLHGMTAVTGEVVLRREL
jgi:ribosomal protein S18 acetylase RimI-like enzyme